MSNFNDFIQLSTDTASTPTKEFLDLPLPVVQTAIVNSVPRKKRKMASLRVYLADIWKRVGAESPSTSSVVGDSTLDTNQVRPRTNDDPDADEVDEIVVDRDWTEDMKSSVNHSERPQDKSGCGSHVTHIPAETVTSLGHESYAIPDDAGLFRQILVFLRWEVWPAVREFFYVEFYDKKEEKQYRRERWFIRKVL